MLKLLIALPLAVAMLLMVRSCWKGDTWGLATLGLLCIVWLRVDKNFEGTHVAVFSQDHGLVLADLVAIIAGLAGLVGWLRRRRPPGRTGGSEAELGDRSAVGDRE